MRENLPAGPYPWVFPLGITLAVIATVCGMLSLFLPWVTFETSAGFLGAEFTVSYDDRPFSSPRPSNASNPETYTALLAGSIVLTLITAVKRSVRLVTGPAAMFLAAGALAAVLSSWTGIRDSEFFTILDLAYVSSDPSMGPGAVLAVLATVSLCVGASLITIQR